MPTVKSSAIATTVQSYYEYVVSANAKFRMGLNVGSGELPIYSDCNNNNIPGCADATLSVVFAPDSYTARFTITIVPTTDAVLTQLSLAALQPGVSWNYELGLVDLGNFSVGLSANMPYSFMIEEKISYPTTI